MKWFRPFDPGVARRRFSDLVSAGMRVRDASYSFAAAALRLAVPDEPAYEEIGTLPSANQQRGGPELQRAKAGAELRTGLAGREMVVHIRPDTSKRSSLCWLHVRLAAPKKLEIGFLGGGGFEGAYAPLAVNARGVR